MRKSVKRIGLFFIVGFVTFLMSFSPGCNKSSSGGIAGEIGYAPDIDPNNFVAVIDNPFFTMTPGATFQYEVEKDEGAETIEVYVTDETRVVMGVTCVVVRDTVKLDGELVEETYDWYAQDNEGNVWYLGEDSKEYESGEVVSTAGSWEGGVDGAMPGIIMMGDPQVGDTYRQEYYAGEAEDMAEVISLNETVTVSYGTFANCLKTKDYTPLEPDVIAYKYYSPTLGAVVMEDEVDGNVELVDVITE